MFDKVVFAGGGHRCWWQAGFWEVLRAEIELRPRVIGAVSMGAFMACLVHANDTRRALAWYERELAGVRSNMAWVNLFRKDEPLFRQGGIYRKAMRALLGGEHFRQLMWQAPEIRVACAVAPAALSDRQLDRLGWREARRDARLVPASLHAKPERAEIFVPLVKRLQDCRTEREMCDLLQASSAYPPLVPAVEFEGERVVTGELVDPVPVDLVADVPGQTLVLTTRTYNRKTPVFAMEGRIYVQSSAPVPVASWDFTSARRFQQTYELGRQDAEAFLKLFGLGAFRTDVQFGGAMLAGGQWGDEARVDTVMDDDGGVGAGSAGAGPAGSGSAGSGSAGSGRGGGSGRAAGAGGTAGADGASGTAGAAGVPGVDGGVDDAAAGAGDGTARARDGKAARDTNRAGFDRDGVAEGGAAEGAAVAGVGAGVGAAGAGIAGASGEHTGAAAGARDARSARADASQADGAGTRGPGRVNIGSGQVAGGARGDGRARRDGAGRSAEADRTAGAGRGSMAADDGAAAGSDFVDDGRRVGIGSAPDGRMSVGGGRDAIPADADGDLIDDMPLTLTDGHTLGEPSDKLFERAGRLPPRSANGGRKEDGPRAGDGKRRGEGARGDRGRDGDRDSDRGDGGRGDTARGDGARKAGHARKSGRKTEK